MKFLSLALTLFTFLAGITAQADSPATPKTYEVTSLNKKYLFKMVPAHRLKSKVPGERIQTIPSTGTAFKILPNGEREKLWQTSGWYSFGTIISDDGRYLVRYGPWASQWKGLSELAIAFYDRGKLLKRYKVGELLKNAEAIEESTSHYTWSPEIQSTPDGLVYHTFLLTMIDKTTYDFDVTTGVIIKTDIDPNAKPFWEVYFEKKKARELEEEAQYNAELRRRLTIIVGRELQKRWGADTNFKLDDKIETSKGSWTVHAIRLPETPGAHATITVDHEGKTTKFIGGK